MSTYHQILYHIVFSTKHRTRCLLQEGRADLFRYMTGVLQNAKCHVYQINGVEDHIHILTSLHPTTNVARVVKDLKIAAHNWIRQETRFPGFTAWQEGYSAFTCAFHDLDAITRYIMNQQAHHQKLSFIQELRKLLAEAGVQFDERFFPEGRISQ